MACAQATKGVMPMPPAIQSSGFLERGLSKRPKGPSIRTAVPTASDPANRLVKSPRGAAVIRMPPSAPGALLIVNG